MDHTYAQEPNQRLETPSNSFPPASRILMTHSTTLRPSQSTSTISHLTDGTLQRRTAEGVQQLRDNLTHMMRGIQPLVASARSINNGRAMTLSNFLNRSVQSEPNSPHPQESNSFVINLDESAPSEAHAQIDNVEQNAEQNAVPEQITQTVNTDGTNPPNGGNATEGQQFLLLLPKYIPFFLILLAKGLYDHREGILNFLVLIITFSHANSVVVKEASKRSRRNKMKLLLAFLYINAAILFIHYVVAEEHLYLNLIFVRTYDKPLTVWDLLWVVGITDFILKLITVMLKIGLTLLPGQIVQFKRRVCIDISSFRFTSTLETFVSALFKVMVIVTLSSQGKVYLVLEATSQLYRSLAPIQPWLYFLLESYQGPEKIVGVFLSAAYMVSKGADLMSRIKLMKVAVIKLLQNMVCFVISYLINGTCLFCNTYV